jgi:hypothetical protein
MQRMFIAVMTLTATLATGQAHGAPFTFVALGDTAYNGERDYPVYRELIAAVNDANPAFSIHIGDIWGAGVCSDAHYALIKDFFALYTGPVVYTPGDNDWTDCRRRAMGGYDSTERLARLRTVFFPRPQSLGSQPMALVREGDVSPYKTFVENARWDRDGVLFATIHVVGSHNNFIPTDTNALVEASTRMQANVSWLRDSFRIARVGEYRALVIAMHAEMFAEDHAEDSAFGTIVDELRLGAERFGKPVLLVHGDYHTFTVDRPFLVKRGEGDLPLYANITRLQVFGAPEIGAVVVSVDPDSIGVFGFTPLLVR